MPGSFGKRKQAHGLLAALLAAALIALSGSSARANHPEFHTYAELVKVLAAWEKRGVKVEVPVQSEEGRDIHLVKVGRGPFTILYTNVLHANEPSGTEAFIRFIWTLLGEFDETFRHDVLPGVKPTAPVFRALRKRPLRGALLDRVTIVGFPMLDPDGVEAGHRRNFLTNLDYSTKLTRQSAALEYAVDRFRPDLFLDSHGGPDRPHLNIGLVEPVGIERAVIRQSRRAGAIAWRSASVLGVRVKYFEEHFFENVLGQHDEPFASADEVYWNSLTKIVPLLQESYQLEGIPTVYTETVGLQSSDPVISISEGASAQQLTMTGLALEYAGLVSGERPAGSQGFVRDGVKPLTLSKEARGFFARVSWKNPTSDYELALENGKGEVVAESRPDEGYREQSKSRALSVRRLPPGRYRLRIEATRMADEEAFWGATWRVRDADGWRLRGILDRPDVVRLCLEGSTVYSDVMSASNHTERLASPHCKKK